ncbi:MAG: cadherin-like domain-containing protein, partial [Verrucomicrobiota bacterium]|nr:cadherin-like domain-containing protein [Verrucomicrobiota bacterium]
MKTTIKRFVFFVFFSISSTLAIAQTYTFTNAGATGREGPEQSEINSAYQGTNLAGKVTINTRGIQEWTVLESGTYRIEAWGAEGGAASGTNGGKGAFSSGLFTLNDGQKLFINIGQKGTDSTGGTRGGGGGGGSFIYDQSQSLKIIAGGGGGTSYQGNAGENGKDNVVGGAGGYTSPTNGNGGITDNGGGGGTGGGGGGVISNGVSNNWSGGGESNGGRGGDSNYLMFGGFGGGGGAFHGGGGGGGYSGGSGGSYTLGGGGGGSYNSGTDQVNTAGVNAGHGKVIITLVSFETFTFTNAGATGREGPTQSQIDSNYSGTNLAGKVTINTRGIQEWTVPESGDYAIEVRGAQGGRGGIDDPVVEGGKGAKMKGIFSLSANTKIKILVGQKGLGGGDDKGGGGGGGSFVTSETNIPLIVAGGGGGGSYHATHGPGVDSRIGGNGNIQIATTTGAGSSANASGGAGFEINSTPGNGAGVAYSFINGAIGAVGEENHDGGFGGGGGGDNSYPSGGGGGGYKGGNASGTNWNQSIGQSKGGFSYNSGISQENSSTLGYNTGHGKVIITLLSPSDSNLQTTTPFIFTNANAVGREGPTQSQIDSNYSGSNLENKVTINTRGFQEWAVPEGGQYKIEVLGASGGSSTYGAGGKGAYMSGKFILEESQLLKIIAGQTGIGNSNGGGGGGGSFVVNAINSTLLIAAGGGGGAGGYLETTINPHLQDGKDAVSGTSGTDAQTQGPGAGFTSLGQGGSSGSGGTGGVSNHPGAGGAGFLTDGTMGQNTAGYHAFAGVSFSSGFIGGDGRGKPNGGFGGGGSTSHGGGGGGGYSGGGGGVWTHPGGADWGHGGGSGGSYNSGTDQNNTSGVNTGHGKVIITFLTSIIPNEPPSISQGEGPISKVTSEDTLTTWTTSELNATDSDTNASKLSWSVLTPPSNGTAVVDGNGTSPQTFTYLPDANYHGNDSFAVMVSDGDKNDSITVNLTINQINDSTIISGDTNSTIDAGTIASGDINATDPDGLTDGSYFAVTQNPLNGSALVDQIDGNWTYIPQSDFFGDDNFTVTITDDLNQSTTQLIHIVVNPTVSVSFTFTNAGATGHNGPTQSEVNLSYVNTNLDGSVTIATQGFQEWTVPSTGNYIIEAFGASGGSSSNSNRLGGKGAKIKGTFSLTQGTKLKIVVGQEGKEGTHSGNKDYGGGGGTFVMQPPYNNTSALLIAAGGGGGAAGSLSTSGNLLGIDASSNQSGTSGASTNGGTGGTNGSGGAVSSGNAGAGAGFLANGGGAMNNAQGKTITNGAVGGFNNLSSGIGGFGGGGGGWHYGGHGGGGGGFSGGGTGGSGYYGGGGGGSFNSGTNQENTAGVNQGHGKVTITFLAANNGQPPQITEGDFEWASHAGGTDRAEAYSVDVFEDGSSLIGGMFFGTANFGDLISLTRTNDADGFIAKLDADGNFTWATKVGCTSSARVTDVAALPDGSSIVTGIWNGT